MTVWAAWTGVKLVVRKNGRKQPFQITFVRSPWVFWAISTKKHANLISGHRPIILLNLGCERGDAREKPGQIPQFSNPGLRSSRRAHQKQINYYYYYHYYYHYYHQYHLTTPLRQHRFQRTRQRAQHEAWSWHRPYHQEKIHHDHTAWKKKEPLTSISCQWYTMTQVTTILFLCSASELHMPASELHMPASAWPQIHAHFVKCRRRVG